MYVVACFLIVFAIAFHFFGWGEKVKKYLFNSASLEKKVENIIKTDLSPKYARASFYIGNNYHHKMSQADWQKYCQESIDNTLDKNSQEYVEAVAPILNAIVLDKEGYYLRRGMENLERSLQRFLPGVNDRISLNYYVEPYEYFENKELAAKSLAEEALRKKNSKNNMNGSVQFGKRVRQKEKRYSKKDNKEIENSMQHMRAVADVPTT